MNNQSSRAWGYYLRGLKKDLSSVSHAYPRMAVFVTGGADSSLLACLARPFRPVLYYGSIASPSQKTYNRRAILRCRKLAEDLKLDFVSVPIRKKDYHSGLRRLKRILPPLCLEQDQDLPAAWCLMKAVRDRQGPGTLVLSGMGWNEFFEADKKTFIRFFSEKFPRELLSHEILAFSLGLCFRSPMGSRNSLLFRGKNRRSRREFLSFLASRRLIPGELVSEPSLHSQIPDDFRRRSGRKDS